MNKKNDNAFRVKIIMNRKRSDIVYDSEQVLKERNDTLPW